MQKLVLSAIKVIDTKYYFDFTDIVNDREKLSLVIDGFYKALAEFECDTVIGSGYGGAQLCGALVARYPEFNSIIVRSTPHKKQWGRQVEGDLSLAKRIVILDDAIFTGESIKELVKIIGEHKSKIVGCVVLYDDWRPLGTRQMQYELFPIKWLVGRRELGLTRDAIPEKEEGLLISKQPLDSKQLRWADYEGNQSAWKMKSVPTIYQGLIINATDRYMVRAYDLVSGEQKWEVRFPGHDRKRRIEKGIIQDISVAADGYLYVGAYDGSIRKIDPLSGAVKYTILISSSNHSTPVYIKALNAFVVNGETYEDRARCGSGFTSMHDAETGKTLWKFQHPDYPPATPCVHDELIYTSANDGSNICLDFSGKLLWKFFSRAEVKGKPLVKQGYLYFIDNQGWLYKLDRLTGQLIWERRASTNGWLITPVWHAGCIVVWDGLLTRGSCIYGFNEDGEREWISSLRSPVAGVAQVSADEMLVVSENTKMAYFKGNTKHWETNYGVSASLASAPAVSVTDGAIALNMRQGGLQVYNIK
jgi:outer membrane protein assembly factor BamB/adenine/guanine phosphoribosyltransferase-like PRPP-binding protein